jgi:hypothetical protein
MAASVPVDCCVDVGGVGGEEGSGEGCCAA